MRLILFCMSTIKVWLSYSSKVWLENERLYYLVAFNRYSTSTSLVQVSQLLVYIHVLTVVYLVGLLMLLISCLKSSVYLILQSHHFLVIHYKYTNRSALVYIIAKLFHCIGFFGITQ